MKINVTENKVSIKEEQILNENEYNIHKIQFDFSSEYTDDLVKVALFSIDNHTYKKIISNNECDIPPEVLTQRGYSILGVYAYKTEQDTLVLRYSPSPTRISVYDGSYKAEAENSEPITPSEIEQYQQILQNSLQQFQNQYNVLVEETEGDIQAIEDELQRKVDEGYFDGEDGFSPIAKVIQKSNGATIEIEDKNGKTTADVLNGADGKDGENGQDGYTPQRGIDYWTEEDKQEVEEEATQQIEGKIEEYNENAAEKLNQYNQNSVQKTNDYNTNAEQKMSAYNTNATEKTSTYNSNAETKKSAYDENATQKTNSFNTNATNKLTEYNTNHTEKMSAYNSNNTEKLNAFNENATQKTEDFDEHTEEIQDNIEILQRTDNQILSRFNKDEEVSGQDIILTGTTEIKFAKPPLPIGNSEQVQYSGKNLAGPIQGNITSAGITIQATDNSILINGTATDDSTFQLVGETITRPSKYFQGIVLNEQNSIKISAGTYILSSNETGLLKFYGNLGDNLGSCTSITTGTAFTITEDKYVWLGIYINSGVAINKTIDNLQLEQGSTATSFEPYVGGQASPNPDYPQEITNVTGDVEVKVQNKNLFVPQTIVDDSNNAEVYLTNDGYIRYKTGSNRLIIKPSLIKENIGYTFKMIGKSDTNNESTIRFYAVYTDGTSEQVFSTARSNTEEFAIFFTTNANKTLDFIRSAWTDEFVAFIKIDEAMILEGVYTSETIPSYVTHKSQTFIFPLGNEKLMLGDYLADDGIHHVRGQVSLNNTSKMSDFRYDSTLNNLSFLIVNIGNCKKGFQRNPLCNQAISASSGDYRKFFNEIKQWHDNSADFVIGLDASIVGTTVTDFRTHVEKKPLIIEYELEEEVIVPYTTAQQRVYNEIKNAYSYDEMTIITGSSDGNKPFFTVQTYKDLNTDLNKNSNLVNGSNTGSLRSISSAIENETYTMGIGSFAVGTDTQASGEMSYAEGEGTKATGWTSHSEGTATEANGDGSHSEGYESKANGIYSHTEGFNTQADGYNQHVEGMNNIVDINNKYAHIIGNGQSDENRSNAHTVDWQGNGWFQGNVKVGGTSQDDTNAQNLITEDKYNRLKATLPTTTGEGQNVTLDKTAEMEFVKPPLPMGNSEQESTTGKNLLATNDYGNYTIANDGTYTNAQSRLSSTYIPLDTTKTDLVFSCKEIAFFFGIAFYDENKNYLSRVYTNSSRYIHGSIPQSAEYARAFFSVEDGSIVLDGSSFSEYELQLEYGTTPTSYEPYTNGASPNPDYPQEITNVTGDVEVVIQNKNLFNKNTVEDGKYINNVGEIKEYHTYILSDYISVKPSTKYSYQGISAFSERLGFYDKNKNLISVDSVSTLPQYQTITTPSNCYYFRTTVLKVDIDKYQFEENSTSTNFVEHREQVFTFPLGNEKLMLGDYLADDGIHHVRGQVVLDGTQSISIENWRATETSVGWVYPRSVTQNKIATNSFIISNKLIACSYSDLFENKTDIGISIVNNSNAYGIAIKIPDTTLNNANAINTYLSNNPILVEYELENEVIVPYTSAQQEAYNQIKQALSYEEQTNINGSSDGSNPIFSVEAYQDIKEKIEEVGGHTHDNKEVLDGISSADITRWNNKSDFSGDYNDLSNKPTIPNVSNFITKDVNNLTNYTLKTNTGSLIDLEINDTTYVVTLKLKNQDGTVISTDTIDLPLESVVVSGRYDNTTKKVILTLENGSEVDFSVADLVAGLQREITSQNKLASDLVDDTNSGNKFVTNSEKQTWNNKLDSEDLTDYVQNTDYATTSKAGIIRTSNDYAIQVSGTSALVFSQTKTFSQYNNASNIMFISKGTLENVITGKNLETANNKTTSMSSSSTDDEYPSAKCVYDYIQSLNGNGVSY